VTDHGTKYAFTAALLHVDVLADTEAQPCLLPDVSQPRLRNMAVGPQVQHGPPHLDTHRSMWSAGADKQETKAELPLLRMLSFACCFL